MAVSKRNVKNDVRMKVEELLEFGHSFEYCRAGATRAVTVKNSMIDEFIHKKMH